MHFRPVHVSFIEPTFDRCGCFWHPYVIERTEPSHLESRRFRARCGLGACAAEVEADDWVDLFVAWNRLVRSQNSS